MKARSDKRVKKGEGASPKPSVKATLLQLETYNGPYIHFPVCSDVKMDSWLTIGVYDYSQQQFQGLHDVH